MNDFHENQELPETDVSQNSGEEDFSTIFADPAAHAERKKTPGKKRLAVVLVSLLCVAILAAGTVAVIKLIPVKEEDDASSEPSKISVVDMKTDDISRVTVTNPNGNFVLYSEAESSDSGDTSSAYSSTKWYLEGYNKELTSDSAISAIARGAASIEAVREVTTKTPEECGLLTPSYHVEVAAKDEKLSYSFDIGDESPDKTGVYLKLAGKDNIYIVESSITGTFSFTALDLASTDSMPAMKVTDSMKDYTNDNGGLISFETMTISGTNFPQDVVITANDNSTLAAYAAYVITSPSKRIAADSVNEVFGIFTGGVAVTGAYSYDVSAAALKQLGLDRPDFAVTVKIADATHYFKFKKQSDGNYAAVSSDSKLVHKVAASTLPFIDYKTTDLYSKWVCLQAIDDLSNFTIKTPDKVYSFDISKNEDEDAEETYNISIDGKKLTASYFQNFYQYCISLSCSDFTVDSINTEPALTIVFTYKDTSKGKDEVAFRKAGETKYQYSIDGIDMGKINSSDFNKILRYAERVADNKDIK